MVREGVLRVGLEELGHKCGTHLKMKKSTAVLEHSLGWSKYLVYKHKAK